MIVLTIFFILSGTYIGLNEKINSNNKTAFFAVLALCVVLYIVGTAIF